MQPWKSLFCSVLGITVTKFMAVALSYVYVLFYCGKGAVQSSQTASSFNIKQLWKQMMLKRR